MLALCAAALFCVSCGEQDLDILSCGIPRLDDAHEPDNNLTQSAAKAALIPFISGSPFTGTADSYFHRDIYEIEATGGEITVDLTFQHSLGDLDLYLFDATGKVLLAESESVTDNESLTFSPTDAKTYYLMVRLFGCPGTAPFPLYYDVEFVETP